MSVFYIIWQDPETRQWFPTGKLQKVDDMYLFVYTQGATRSPRFIPFGNMSRTDVVYVSKTLFPIFANRVLSDRRPEYRNYASWSDLDAQDDPLILMGRMGGGRATDTLQVYSVPEKSLDGKYRTVFFCHGISHLPSATRQRALELQSGDRLFPMLDVQNPFDSDAVALRTDDPTWMLGYCPRHLSVDIRDLLTLTKASLRISVRKVNAEAPVQFSLLCEAVAEWPAGFEPCGRNEYQSLVQFDTDQIILDARHSMGLSKT